MNSTRPRIAAMAALATILCTACLAAQARDRSPPVTEDCARSDASEAPSDPSQGSANGCAEPVEAAVAVGTQAMKVPTVPPPSVPAPQTVWKPPGLTSQTPSTAP